ncbi:MAG TPA: hypothetical protein PKK36_11495 [Kiritimatiellia bacterium]|nr:hypothetical protein [Kiritimatiellia bacterium]
MAEYGLLASKSAEFLTGIFGRLHGFWDAIPYGTSLAAAAGIAVVVYLTFRKR